MGASGHGGSAPLRCDELCATRGVLAPLSPPTASECSLVVTVLFDLVMAAAAGKAKFNGTMDGLSTKLGQVATECVRQM
eukprot:1574913-Amphidinium_carterae.1